MRTRVRRPHAGARRALWSCRSSMRKLKERLVYSMASTTATLPLLSTLSPHRNLSGFLQSRTVAYCGETEPQSSLHETRHGLWTNANCIMRTNHFLSPFRHERAKSPEHISRSQCNVLCHVTHMQTNKRFNSLVNVTCSRTLYR
jgi:hypothetical protein